MILQNNYMKSWKISVANIILMQLLNMLKIRISISRKIKSSKLNKSSIKIRIAFKNYCISMLFHAFEVLYIPIK